ncbi:hypothetical protein AWW67_02205 [Roseivirga seohaensis]|uniref:Uncharacterized protein n=1 Tax=Roseivirga seohaensis TaxID=1914963 RepID=A0A150XZ77_9BACT|nr:helix-turn-helix domain-containing protein [Roseivirga seohaensis]KYG83952.1 hypothetical protein AWW67_02205 [Roseivirga seohaensis]
METQFLIIPKSEFDELKFGQQRILEAIRTNHDSTNTDRSEYLTSKEFMERIKIARSKFDELVADGKVKTVRPNGGRKIYVPASEVARYFEGE